MPTSPLEEMLTTGEAMTLLGYKNASSIARLVYEHKLVPARKLPGKNGAYLFDRADVAALATSRSVGALIESGALATIVYAPVDETEETKAS